MYRHKKLESLRLSPNPENEEVNRVQLHKWIRERIYVFVYCQQKSKETIKIIISKTRNWPGPRFRWGRRGWGCRRCSWLRSTRSVHRSGEAWSGRCASCSQWNSWRYLERQNREQKIIKMQEPFSSPNPMKSDAKSPIFSFFVSSEAERNRFLYLNAGQENFSF